MQIGKIFYSDKAAYLAHFVIPAKAGIQILCFHCTMDAHFRGHDILFLKFSQDPKPHCIKNKC